jgi:hypothetical protein
MTNHLADELREIDRELDHDPCGYVEITTRQRLRALIANVERLHAEPESATELTASGLDPEQEIRARALDAVARLFTGAPPTMFGATELAEDFADWIRDGGRP